MQQTVAQFLEVVMEYVATGSSGSFDFLTDMPGGSMASRITPVSLPVTPSDKSPKTITIPLLDANNAPIEGTLFQPKWTPGATGTLQVRSASVKLRHIGVYLDGTRGEVWTTQPIPVGT